MTPQERELIVELFDRLASLERNPRDPQAEAAIREGLRDAPNAIYPLVQTVLVQDEALKAANARLQEYEGGAPQGDQRDRGFLDSMRDSIFGRDEPPRGSVPRTGPGSPPPGGVWTDSRPQGSPMGVPPGYRNDPWDRGAPSQMEPPPQRAGGSFLGTAAAAAAGAIGGALLMNSIRSALGGHQAGPMAGAFDQLSGANNPDRTPFGNPTGGDLARELGAHEIGNSRTPFGDVDRGRPAGLFGDNDRAQPAGMFDAAPQESGNDDGDYGDSEGGGFDSDSDEA